MNDRNQNIMLDLPPWIRDAIPELNCPHCNNSMETKYVLSIGIRRSKRTPSKTVLFFEYECGSCKLRSIVELNAMSLDEFINSVSQGSKTKNKLSKKNMFDNDQNDHLDAENDMDEVISKPLKRKLKKTSKISEKEITDFVQKLRNCNNSIEFLLSIGLTQEEMEEYGIYNL